MDLNCPAAETLWHYAGCEVVNWGVPLAALIAVIAFHRITDPHETDQSTRQNVKPRTEPQAEAPEENDSDYATHMERKGMLTHPVHRKLWLLAAAAVSLLQGYLTYLVMRQAAIWVYDAWDWDTGDDWGQQFLKPIMCMLAPVLCTALGLLGIAAWVHFVRIFSSLVEWQAKQSGEDEEAGTNMVARPDLGSSREPHDNSSTDASITTPSSDDELEDKDDIHSDSQIESYSECESECQDRSQSQCQIKRASEDQSGSTVMFDHDETDTTSEDIVPGQLPDWVDQKIRDQYRLQYLTRYGVFSQPKSH